MPPRRALSIGAVVAITLVTALGSSACGGDDAVADSAQNRGRDTAHPSTSSAPSRSSSTSTKSGSGSPISEVVADWRMDEPPGSQTLIDDGPDGLDGTIGSQVSSGVEEQGAVAQRRAAVAPDEPPVAVDRLAEVPHDKRLNPGDGPYAVTVRLRTTSPKGNVVQKGQFGVPGGYFKIDMDDGRVACLFLGSKGSSHARSRRSIVDGRWHEVRCERDGDDLVLRVDGAEVARRDKPVGSIDNTFPLTIAGKLACDQVERFCDYFSGDIDRVLIERG
ncbi:MAG: hypothetical protein H6515_13280 [Microthrixaceae bacterium]|nr:hypothetical protein [Microthrixaceae bacterium]